jgi:hypothetical protein
MALTLFVAASRRGKMRARLGIELGVSDFLACGRSAVKRGPHFETARMISRRHSHSRYIARSQVFPVARASLNGSRRQPFLSKVFLARIGLPENLQAGYFMRFSVTSIKR